eukprot:TRINITY_DN22369_c0_g1_i1.p1 TRINITY_DN22369_c0_g1~~TRINITY_DN22369_c0_g1_i1.p1  ORF type:complete len:683 (+),score=137.56 TRINITY_DN22369_c0_g1_i1:100-2148(+)
MPALRGMAATAARPYCTQAYAVPAYPPPDKDRVERSLDLNGTHLSDYSSIEMVREHARFVRRWAWMYQRYTEHVDSHWMKIYRDEDRSALATGIGCRVNPLSKRERHRPQFFTQAYLERLDPRVLTVNEHVMHLERMTARLQFVNGVSGHYIYSTYGAFREKLPEYTSAIVAHMCMIAARLATVVERATRMSLRTGQSMAVLSQLRAFVAAVTELICEEEDWVDYLDVVGCCQVLMAMSVLQVSSDLARRRIILRLQHGDCIDSCDVPAVVLTLYVERVTGAIPRSVIAKLLDLHPRWSTFRLYAMAINVLYLCATLRIPVPDAAVMKCFSAIKFIVKPKNHQDAPLQTTSALTLDHGQLTQLAAVIYHYNMDDPKLLESFLSALMSQGQKGRDQAEYATVYCLLARVPGVPDLSKLARLVNVKLLTDEALVHFVCAVGAAENCEDDLREEVLGLGVERVMDGAGKLDALLIVRVLGLLGRLGGRAKYEMEIEALEAVITQRLHELNGHALRDLADAFRRYTPSEGLKAALIALAKEMMADPAQTASAVPFLMLLSTMNAPHTEHEALFATVADQLQSTPLSDLLDAWQAVKRAKIVVSSSTADKLAKHIRPAAAGLSLDESVTLVTLLAATSLPLSRSGAGLLRVLTARIDAEPPNRFSIYQRSSLSYAYQVLDHRPSSEA